jgi:hypothetical protein
MTAMDAVREAIASGVRFGLDGGQWPLIRAGRHRGGPRFRARKKPPSVAYLEGWRDVLSPEVRARLLASMDAGRLVVVCGAGLSMAPPSNLPSARRVAEMCFDEYALTADPHCNPALRENLESLAEHFAALNTLKTVFIEHLVPWPAFVCPPNPGHAAIADFLITRAAVAGLSSNYDY